MTNGGDTGRNQRLVPVNKTALYKGFRVFVYGHDDNYYHVEATASSLPNGLLLNMEHTQIAEYHGLIPINDEHLNFVE